MDENLHKTDQELMDILDGMGDHSKIVRLTPEVMSDLAKTLDARETYIRETFPRLVAECPYETKLAVTAWVMGHLVEHARSGGSYRHLIYNRLGFDVDAYFPLQMAGGLEISNEFNLKRDDDENNG